MNITKFAAVAAIVISICCTQKNSAMTGGKGGPQTRPTVIHTLKNSLIAAKTKLSEVNNALNNISGPPPLPPRYSILETTILDYTNTKKLPLNNLLKELEGKHALSISRLSQDNSYKIRDKIDNNQRSLYTKKINTDYQKILKAYDRRGKLHEIKQVLIFLAPDVFVAKNIEKNENNIIRLATIMHPYSKKIYLNKFSSEIRRLLKQDTRKKYYQYLSNEDNFNKFKNIYNDLAYFLCSYITEPKIDKISGPDLPQRPDESSKPPSDSSAPPVPPRFDEFGNPLLPPRTSS